MKRLVLTFVAVLALFSTVQTAKADWVIEIKDGWMVLVWDPAFPGSTPLPPPPPPGTTFPYIELLSNGLWYLIGGLGL